MFAISVFVLFNGLTEATNQQHRGEENTMNKSAAYFAGVDAKNFEIKEMGFEAARDKFNLEYPVGQKWQGSADGLDYSKGEFDALCKAAGIQ